MTLREIEMTLDLDRRQYYYPALEMIQGDNNSLKVNVTVLQQGIPVSLDGYKISFFANFPGTNEFVFDSDNISNEQTTEGQFSYVFPNKTNQVPGDYTTARFNIISQDGTEISKMARFQYHVESDPAEGSVEAETWISDFNALLEAIQEMNDKYDTAVDDINQSILEAKNTQADLELEMQALRDEIAESGNVKVGDTTNWQKYKLTNDSGIAKSTSSSITTLSSFVDAGVYYISSSVAANLTDIPLKQGFRLENRRLVSGTSAEQTIRYFSSTDGEACREFRRYGKSTWAEFETVKGAQAKIELAKSEMATLYQPILSITPWTAPTLNANFSIVSSSYPLLYRRKGTVLQVKGAINRTSGAKGVIFTLPNGFRPKERRARACGHVSSANGAVATIYIQTNGDVELTNAFNDTGVWIEFDLELE